MLQIASVSIAGYRSLRSIRFPVGSLTVFLGQNGAGKTNLYRALQLLHSAAAGTFAREIAAEGGMESILWAGVRRKGPARAIFSVDLVADRDHSALATYNYAIEAGIAPPIAAAAFPLEPQVKQENLASHVGRRGTTLLERRGPLVKALNEDARMVTLSTNLMASETALGNLDDALMFPDQRLVRATLLDWRFYHDLRTDGASPLRQPCLAVTSPTLASDGSNLAAVLATLAHIRQDMNELDEAIGDAFPGAQLVVPVPGRLATFGMIFRDFVFPPQQPRVFEPAELSDGTLRYLALAGALLAYRLPAFIALNEPEGSLHPDLMEPLARMIVRASKRTQVWVVTHSKLLAEALGREGKIEPLTLVKDKGETRIRGADLNGARDEDE